MPDMTKVEKIKKLLALSQSSNANEAALAAQRAKELMIEYAIEEHHLAPTEREPVGVEYMGLEVRRVPMWVPMWEAQLAYVLAPSFFCNAYFVRGLDIKMVGRKSDREALSATFFYLRGCIKTMAEAAWATKPADFSIHGKRWKNSFYQGCVAAIRERLEGEQASLTGAATSAETAIVLAERMKEVDDYVKKNVQLRKTTHSTRISGDGYANGQMAGKTLDLSKRAGASKALGA